MLFRTHLVFALFLFSAFVLNSNLTIINKLIFFIVFVIAASFPDIDMPRSKIGRKTKPISNLINLFFMHRGFFQSLTFVILLSIFLLIFSVPKIIILAFSGGYSSHLLLDSFTKKGLYVLWPLKLKIKGPIKTGSLAETLLFLVFLIALIFTLFKNFNIFKLTSNILNFVLKK